MLLPEACKAHLPLFFSVPILVQVGRNWSFCVLVLRCRSTVSVVSLRKHSGRNGVPRPCHSHARDVGQVFAWV